MRLLVAGELIFLSQLDMISLPVNEEPSELSAIKSAEDAIKTLSSDDFIVKVSEFTLHCM